MSDLLILGAIGLLGFLCQWLAWRLKLPAILFLLTTGVLLGPIFGLVNPEQLFGDLLAPLVSLSVAIILFEGSLTLKRVELVEIGTSVRNMVTFGALINAVITATATHVLTGLNWSISALFGAIMVVTGPTVVMPMLRAVRLSPSVSRTLRWEGIVIDPVGALLAVLVFEWIVASQSSETVLHAVSVFSQTFGLGLVLGGVVGHCFGLLLRHGMIPEYLIKYAAVAFVTSAFAVSNTVLHESGLLTVTVMGLWLANMRDVHTRDILSFKESLTLILVSGLFIILAADLKLSSLLQLGWVSVALLLIVQLVARPLKVFISTIGSPFTLRERMIISWIGPRGIVAAAVSVVFAARLEELGMAGADLLVPLAFSLIIGTVLLQGLTVGALARLLGVTEPDARGQLIIGANPVAREIARALDEAGIKVMLADTEWRNVSAARIAGLPCYHGNPISDHAELHLDTSRLGSMLGLSIQHSQNTAAAVRFREDFGVRNVYTLASEDEEKSHEKYRASELYTGRLLFDSGCRFEHLQRRLDAGARIRATQLSSSYTFAQWLEDNPQELALLLFAITDDGRIRWFSPDTSFDPEPGWTVHALRTDENL